MSLHKTQGFWPVAVAIGGNATVTVIKLISAIASGSSVMFSEAIHSAADTLNQLLLLIGLRRSLKKADDVYAYGYGNERFFWALISACGIFFVGGGITAYRGVEALFNPQEIEFSVLIGLVLIASFVIELYTLRIATQQIVVTYPNLSWRERIDSADSATLAVLLEDSVAVIGVMVAATSIGAAYITGSTLWDALGSIVIALMLACVAVVLIVKNRSYLLGRAMPDELRDEIITIVRADSAVKNVSDFKSSAIGFGTYRIKCEVEFNGTALLRESYRSTSLKKIHSEIQSDVEAFKRFLADYSDRIPRLMGKRIDEIEAKIRNSYPSVRHIDIELN